MGLSRRDRNGLFGSACIQGVGMEASARAIVDTAVDGIILIDRLGMISVFNPACEQIFGYRADEVVGQNVKILMPEPFHKEHDGYLKNYQRTGDRKIIGIGREVVGQRKNGTTFPMDLSVGEAMQNGEPLFVGIIRDITDRRRDEVQKEKLIHTLALKNEELGHFAHVVSHDLRQSLRMVCSFSGILQSRYAERLDRQGMEYLELSVSAAKQMTALLDDLLEYSQLDAQSDRLSWFDPDACLHQILKNFAESLRISGATVTHDPMPAIFGNPIRFTRLLQNLISNSIKYVEEGDTPRIHVSGTSEPDRWVFSVRDNGIGIDAQYHTRIFEPFKRLHNSLQYSGTGMGLALCKRIAEGFGGQIYVQSSPGDGATFFFSVIRPEGHISDE